MTADNNRPIIFRVEIEDTGLNTTAPSDGFIDSTSVARYRSINTLTGTDEPGMSDGDTIRINGVHVTFTIAGGLDLAGVVDTIAALTTVHHVIPYIDGTNLVLTNEPLFEGYGITVTEVTSGALARMGFAVFTTATVPGTNVSTLVLSRAKERANSRWERVITELSQTASPVAISNIEKNGGTVDDSPSRIELSVAFVPGNVFTYDENNNNEIIWGVPAVKRMIARALMWSGRQIRVVFDPTLSGDGFALGNKLETVTIGALADDLATAEGAITVSVVSNV